MRLGTAPLVVGNFPQFSGQHWTILGICLVGCVALGVLGNRLRGRPGEWLVRRILGTAVLCFGVPVQLWEMISAGSRFYTSLPLQLCDLDWMVAAWALFTTGWRSRSVLYYWALTLTVQAIVTPSLGHLWPDPLFIGFWGVHVVTLWSAAYLCIGVGHGPDWRSYRWALLCTAVWAVLVMPFNAAVGTNYGFLNAKPPESSLLDLLGPWPVYVLEEAAVIVAGWALLTWPWVAARHSPRSS
ncbi:MAG TPA: TIGR02206 family membrane protein [Marmoricola sp.]|nr:TIGR02206 family membrane protein [Marmoricola sp.]